jgi:hypothetical protein
VLDAGLPVFGFPSVSELVFIAGTLRRPNCLVEQRQAPSASAQPELKLDEG